jgi:uncharacterized protein (DUF1330 family)
VSVYVIAQLRFKDRERYERYQQRFMGVLQQYPGAQLLAADESPEQVEGQWDHDKVVLLSFPDDASYQAWSTSAEYQEIAVDRRAGADTVAIRLRGI